MTPKKSLLSAALTAPLACAAALVAPACIVHDDDTYVVDEPDSALPGDITFAWSFAGEPRCDVARVDEIDIVVLRDGAVVDVIEREPCVGGGLTLTDYEQGRYTVEVDAYARDSELLFSGGFPVSVLGGRDNDVGVVELAPIDALPPPAPTTGAAALYWGFSYPTSAPVFDCALAGVDEVDVEVTPVSDGASAPFITTLPCDDDGVVLEDLLPGRYELHLQGYGLYASDDVLLYDTVVDLGIDAGATTDLGDVTLERVEENFTDLEFVWDFRSDTCGTAGVSSVTVAVQRVGASEPEDIATYDCGASLVIRRTFVPGAYLIQATADGFDATWIAATTTEVAPGTVARAELMLVPTP